MSRRAFCTILARNYLPSALALSDSLRRHEGDSPLVVLVIDATSETQFPEVPGVRWMGPSSLELPRRTVLELAMSYDLVEFATSLKPLLLQALLREHEQAVYLDPDTYVVSAMAELGPALDASVGIVLTPHYLDPAPSGSPFSEGHLLHVGVYNLGFCAVSRAAAPFLSWWWGHLRWECLHDPLAGLFVDQKWVDIGSTLFGAAKLQHYGYNVGVANIHERPLARDAEGYYIASTGDRLRLFHFHAFDPGRPETLSSRFLTGARPRALQSEPLRMLCAEYATAVLEKRRELGPQPPYLYAADSTGRPISRSMRHAYRAAARSGGAPLPSPFLPEEAAEYQRWRRGALRLAGRLTFSDVVKGLRCALPDEYDRLKARTPGLMRRLRARYLEDTGMWQ